MVWTCAEQELQVRGQEEGQRGACGHDERGHEGSFCERQMIQGGNP